ncbi:54S ribosomal protein L9, mitochondrial [Komagataella phaffii CBS 7435]|uniref:Large ribosomal subunit protein uL3m n=2 Tax=Komagataella phaffii TaxID=460519 RepID=C4R2F2_KOMPG|nr:mitochondrial 54S ribosomal protein YmL9 [Komagataella phaffii GS115]AOA63095.1 GQ67_01094T0 [Komagataella phaffii]CAH2447771.1 54S ribosomal protein L9, mitochondrial [Komagataella phaffii CBS 7435]AOA67466.1 GQ68_00295T0 [Komagataella phaffii GS115]CAY69676.1 Mitochondrial ribosomal protein of the large subunit [Komagataella phaffii GS115]CCA37948.1 54S ribosomal protein L9, mitochondrial [Komagataella phaffii CBS 7435]
MMGIFNTLKPLIAQRFKAHLTSPGAIPFVETKAAVLFKSPELSRLRKRLLTRPGLIGVKRGMVPFYTNEGLRIPCTVLEIDQVEVTHNKTVANDGYSAVQVGYGFKLKNQTKKMLGHFAKAQVSPKEKVVEFHVKSDDGLLPVGTLLKADHFKVGEFVDLQSISKGKGFAGVMKRWNFHGLKASHGVSKAHRSAGSTGGNQTPGRTLPGKKMAGRMGGHNVTLQNVEVVDVNAEKGYILIKGPVSGATGSYVKIQDAIKRYH